MLYWLFRAAAGRWHAVMRRELVDALKAALEARAVRPAKPAEASALTALREDLSADQVQAFALLFGADDATAEETGIAHHLDRLVDGREAPSPDKTGDWARACLARFQAGRRALLEAARSETPDATIAERAAALRTRILLGDPCLEEADIHAVHKAAKAKVLYHNYRRSTGHVWEAAALAERLNRAGLRARLRASIQPSLHFLQPGRPVCPPETMGPLDLVGVAARFQALFDFGRYDEIVEAVRRHPALLGHSPPLLNTVLPALQCHAPLSEAECDQLTASFERANFATWLLGYRQGVLNAYRTESALPGLAAWLLPIAKRAADQALTPLEARPLLGLLYEARPALRRSVEPMGDTEASLLALLSATLADPGDFPDVAQTPGPQLCLPLGGRTQAPVETRLTESAEHVLAEMAKSGTPWFMVSNHAQPNGLNLVLSRLSVASGRRVVSVTRQTSDRFMIVRRAARWTRFLSEDQARRIHIMEEERGYSISQTRKILAELGANTVLEFTNDAPNGSGARTFVPWLSQPFALRYYIAQLTLLHRGRMAFHSSYIDRQGIARTDLIEVDLPPEGVGSLMVRAQWLMQRVARAARRRINALVIPYAPNKWLGYGGRPAERQEQPFETWRQQEGVRSSVFGWIAGDDEAEPLPDAADPLSARQLAQPARRLAAVIAHCEAARTDKVSSPDSVLAPYRVMVIAPPGAVMAATVAAGLARGSLVCCNQTDIPANELLQRIADFGPHLVIGTASAWSSLTEARPGLETQAVLIVDDAADTRALDDLVSGFSPCTAFPAFQPERPGLLVYTSGSDGRPKGVVLPAGLLSNGAGLDHQMEVGPGDRVLYLTRWDAVGIADLLACLRGGAELLVPGQALTRSPEAIARAIAEHRITTLSAPTSLWEALARTAAWARGEGTNLEKGLVWGERIPPATVAKLRAVLGDRVRLFSIFGATEATYVALAALSGGRSPPDGASPGGWLCPGVALAPADAADRFEISGPDVMLGYWRDLKAGDASLPRERVRRFHSADRLAVEADGFVSVLGRADDVVKIMGRRVSLDAVAVAAEQVDGVVRVLVWSQDDGPMPALCLAVEAAERPGLAGELNAAVFAATGNLVSASTIHVLDAFPLLPSGKVDKARLTGRKTSAGTISVPDPAAVSDPVIESLLDWAARRGGSREAPLTEIDSISALELSLLADELGAGPAIFDALEAGEIVTLDGLAQAIRHAQTRGSGPRPPTNGGLTI